MNDCVIFQLYHNLSKRSMTFDIEFNCFAISFYFFLTLFYFFTLFTLVSIRFKLIFNEHISEMA